MRRAGWAILASLLILAGTSLPARAAADPWHVAAQLALETEGTAVSCAPNTSACWAIESGQLLSSDDAGASWTNRTDLAPTYLVAFDDVACPTATRCYLVATGPGNQPYQAIVDHGAMTAAAAPWLATQSSIDCVSAQKCFATDGTYLYGTTDGGQTWPGHPLPAIVYTRPGLDCVANTTRCWVVGDRGETPLIERTVDGGQTWTQQTAPGSTDGLYDVACPTTTSCYAAGADFGDDSIVIRTTNAGNDWTFSSVPYNAYAYRSISCPAVTTCVAVGQSPGNAPFVSTTSDGATWTKQAITPTATDFPAALSCPSVTQCALVAGGVGDVSTDGGVTWTQLDLPSAVEAPAGLSCARVTQCVGVGNDSAGRAQAITTTDGTTWTAHGFPAGAGRLWAVDCPSRLACYAVGTGTGGQAYWSADAGHTWAAGKLASVGAALNVVTCASATTCLAGGFDNRSRPKLLLTTNSGRNWKVVTPPPGFYLDGLACSSVTSCVVITADPQDAPIAYTTADLGATYTAHTMPDDDIYSADCNGSLCAAVGSNGGDGAISVSRDFGATWTAASFPRRAQIFGKVSCGSATQCAATAYDFTQTGGPLVVGTVNGGQTWQAFAVPARHEQPIAIGCRAAQCFASDVGPNGNPLILAGRA